VRAFLAFGRLNVIHAVLSRHSNSMLSVISKLFAQRYRRGRKLPHRTIVRINPSKL
jgi:hypothetical protein